MDENQTPKHIFLSEKFRKFLRFFHLSKSSNSKSYKYLSDLVKDSKVKEHQNSKVGWQHIVAKGKLWISSLWIPSMNSFFTAACFAVILGWLAHLKVYSFPFFSQQCGFIYNFFLQQELLQIKPSDLIAVHAGMGAILVGLAFFVAAKMGNRSDPYEGQVLLYRSYFFPLLTFQTFIFLGFSWGTLNVVALFSLLLVAIFTVVSVARVISVLLRETDMDNGKASMLFQVIDKVRELSDNEIRKRIGNNHLYLKYESNQTLNVGYLDISGATDAFVKFKLSSVGTITDINLDELNQFENSINSFKIVDGTTNINETRDKKVLSVSQPSCSISPVFLENINHENGLVVVKIDPKIVEKMGKHSIERYLERIFVVKNSEDIETYVRMNISRLKDSCLRAAKDGNSGELEKTLRLYLKIVERFFDSLEIYGGQFSYEQAKQERNAFPFQSLKTIDWIKDDIREIYECGLKVNDRKIISLASYFPMALAAKAIERGDHLVFQEFIFFPTWGYTFVKRHYQTGETELADFLLDRIWRYLDELSWLHVESAFKKGHVKSDEFAAYSTQFLLVFQSLLKSSLDTDDYNQFDLFLGKTNKLFDGLDYEHSEEAYEARIQFSKKRKQMLFGLGSWILHLCKDQKLGQKKRYLNPILDQFAIDLEGATETFLDVHSFGVENFWGWSGWELAGREGETVCIHFLEKLEHFYAIIGLKYLSGKTEADIAAIELPTNSDLAFLAQGGSALSLIIKNIETVPDEWRNSHILVQAEIEKTTAFKNLLEVARKTQEENDLKRKRETSISPTMVDKFKQALIDDYSKSNGLRKLLHGMGNLTDKTDETYTGNVVKRGVKTLYDKAAFFDPDVPWHVSFLGIDNAFGFGQSISRGEDFEIFWLMQSICENASIENFLEKIGEVGTENAVILCTDHMLSYDVFEKMDLYVPKWRNDFPTESMPDGADGALKHDDAYVPIFFFPALYPQREILILDKRKIGNMTQFSPLSEGEDANLRFGLFFVNIQEFLPESKLTNDFISGKPAWLQEYGSETEQSKYLQECVLIEVFSRFEYVPSNGFYGYRFNDIK